MRSMGLGLPPPPLMAPSGSALSEGVGALFGGANATARPANASAPVYKPLPPWRLPYTPPSYAYPSAAAAWSQATPAGARPAALPPPGATWPGTTPPGPAAQPIAAGASLPQGNWNAWGAPAPLWGGGVSETPLDAPAPPLATGASGALGGGGLGAWGAPGAGAWGTPSPMWGDGAAYGAPEISDDAPPGLEDAAVVEAAPGVPGRQTVGAAGAAGGANGGRRPARSAPIAARAKARALVPGA